MDGAKFEFRRTLYSTVCACTSCREGIEGGITTDVREVESTTSERERGGESRFWEMAFPPFLSFKRFVDGWASVGNACVSATFSSDLKVVPQVYGEKK